MIAESVDHSAISGESRCTWVEYAKDPGDEIAKRQRQSIRLRISGLVCAAAFVGSLSAYYDGHTQDRSLLLAAAASALPAFLLYGFGLASRDSVDSIKAPKGTSDFTTRREVLGPVIDIHFVEFLAEGRSQLVGDTAFEIPVENGPIPPIPVPSREYMPIPLADAGYYRVKNDTPVNED